MGDGRVNFKFRADNSEVLNAADQAEKSLSEMANEAEKSGSRIGAAFSDTGLRDMTADISELNDNISEQAKYVDGLSSKYADLARQAGEAFMAGRDSEYRALNIEMQNLNSTITEENRTLDELKTKLVETEIAQNAFQNATARSSEALQSNEGFMMRMLGGTDNYKKIISSLPGPIGGAVTAIGGMTKAAMAFIATPLGAIIAAIVIALKALSSWFTSSAEGQREFTKISSYLGGILGQLKEIVIAVGKALFKAFTDPKKAIGELWEFVKQNIVNRFEAVGGIFKALGEIISKSFKGDFSGAAESVKELGSQALKAATGVDNLLGKIGDYAKNVHEAAKETQALKVAEEQLAIDRSKFSVQEAQLRAAADAAYQKYQKSGMKDRASLVEYEKNINEIYDKREGFAKEELRIKQGLAALTTNSLEDNEALNAAEKDLIAIQSERIQALRRADRAAGALSRKEESGAETAAQKAEKAFIKETIDQYKKLSDAKKELERSYIKDKKELRAFDLTQILNTIDKEKRAYVALAKVKGETMPDISVFLERENAAIAASRQEQAIDEEEKNKKTLEEYATFSEKYIAKVKELEKKKAEIIAAGGTEANIKVAVERTDKELKDLDAEYFKMTTGFKEFSGSLVKASINSLKALLSELQTKLAESKESVDSESNAALRAQIEILQAQITTKEEKSKTTELEKWQNTNKVLSDIIQTTTQVINGFDDIDDSIKKIINTTISLASNTLKMVDGLKTLSITTDKTIAGSGKKSTEALKDTQKSLKDSTKLASTSSKTIGSTVEATSNLAEKGVDSVSTAADAASEGVQSTSKVAGESIKAVEKASVILSIISAAIQVATAIADLFTSGAKKRREEERKLREEINRQEKEYNDYLRERILLFEQSRTIFGLDEYGKATNAAREAIRALGEEQTKLTEGGKARLKFTGIKQGFKDVRTEMEKVYGGLGNIEIKTGTKKSGLLGLGRKDVYEGILKVYPDLITAEGRLNIAQAKSILNARTMSDESKNALQGMIDAAEQAEKALAMVNEYLEGIFGDLGNTMTSNFASAFKEGKSSAVSFVDDISGLLEKLSQDMLYSIMLQPLFDEASKQMKEIMGKTGLSDQEKFKQFSKILGGLAVDAQAKQSEMTALLEQFKKDAAEQGLNIFESTTKKAQAEAAGKGIQALTQETGTRLEGVMTSTSISTANTADNTKISSEAIVRTEPIIADIRDTMDILALNTRKIYDEVILIRQNTAYLPGMDRKLSEVVTNTAR